MKGIPLPNLPWICLHILYLAVRSISATTEDALTCRVPYVSFGTVTPRKTGDYCATGDFIIVRCDASYGILVNKNFVSELILQCNQNGEWTQHGWPIDPQCIEPIEACEEPHRVENAAFTPMSLFRYSSYRGYQIGTEVIYKCNAGYKIDGPSTLQCLPSGVWSHAPPSCVSEKDITIDSKTEAPAEESTHMSTLAIVVATACSVLGVLLLIMVIMVFRRRKPHPPRLIRPSSTPPPYSRVNGSGMDEHDRVLLIGYENTNVQLPSYEEAISGPTRTTTQVARSGQVGDYRPLPSLPGNYRSGPSLSGDTSRHSIITTSTMNRDGLSEGFGSIDTVNVSVSDASTAVTIETFDSAGSHHSNMSRRATACSISSSNGSIVTEDAPLLESNQRTEEIDLGVNEADVRS